MKLATRRIGNVAAATVLGAMLVGLAWIYGAGLRSGAVLSGWFLLVAMLLLTLYNVRKKVSVLPLFGAAAWLQGHVYLGLIAMALFFQHAGLRVPDGPLEAVVWGLFLATSLSGILGLFIARTFPGRLDRHGETVLFERIPMFRLQLAREVEDLAIRSAADAGSTTITDYFVTRLEPFFRGSRNGLAHLFEVDRPLYRMLGEMRSLRRFLDPRGRDLLAEIQDRVIAKDNLDYQYALQAALKGWLFVHVPLTYSLLAAALVHLVVVYAYSLGSL